MKLDIFSKTNFLDAVKALFTELNVPVNYISDEPTTAKEILKDTYKDNDTFKLVNDVYFVGMVDDAAFEGEDSIKADTIKSDYDGILIFALTLKQREKNLLPTRSQLAEISRTFNREFYYTPVVLVFKYKDDQKKYLAFANTDRLKYNQEWREGEKTGKVSLLRDIDIQKPHAGHERIIGELEIPRSGRNAVDSFAKLYNYWQQVFNVSILNKKFYQELSNWYFWAINHVKFPSEPTIEDAHRKGANLDELIKEHNATNVIRLLTRLLFTWFIKEKQLVPEELFDLDALQKDILNEISPYHENGMFKDANKESVYYKAILQNLFFASLNCPIEADETDSRVRQFRGDETYGKHRGIDWMMRYKKHFKNPDAFLQLMNKTVPFLNGGLFECLDDKTQNHYIDGFSDQMTKGEQLVVPDYLFFGATEHVDLSPEYGLKNKGTKQAAVKGLINILHSYKFTVTENTPVEEDVALDPELLGKVFENLLASYNPETKTTARKQTGSFYTPREIVNYMVDESLIAYLKNNVPGASSSGTTESQSKDALDTFFNPNDEIEIKQGNLPHWYQKEVFYHITFRLADSIPKEKVEELKADREKWHNNHKDKQEYTKEDWKEYNRLFNDKVEEWMNAGYGSCLLKKKENAAIVANALKHFDGQRYVLDEWVVMPNHVHVLVKPLGDNKISDILHSWKSFTANEINKNEGRKGQLWMHESFDHIVRNEKALNAIRKYIRENPVKADIVPGASSFGITPAASSFKNKETQSNDALGTLDQSNDALGTMLHQLVSFDQTNPFKDDPETTRQIIKAIDECKILDPACGSGAFPMGILQKMVHMLQKLDPENTIWKEVQKNKAKQAADDAFEIEDKEERSERLREIDEAFDRSINDPDYARKLYLIENCIYGVDIQPIATQISKLRFFISLVVDQHKCTTGIPAGGNHHNFGIRPLPNLETKFVAANTLIGSEKPKAQTSLFDTPKVKELEAQLKKVRSKLFSAKTKETKLKYRQQDEKLRNAIATELKNSGWPNNTAEKLAAWDPYDQNASSTFFDPEWMFDVSGGFDLVIGNPPYRPIQKYTKEQKLVWSKEGYSVYSNSGNIYFLFFEKGLEIAKNDGVVNYITSNQWMRNKSGQPLRELFLKYNPEILIDFRGTDIFENVAVLACIMQITKRKQSRPLIGCDVSAVQNGYGNLHKIVSDNSIELEKLTNDSWLIFDKQKHELRELILSKGKRLSKWGLHINYGIKTGFNEAFYLTKDIKDDLIKRDANNPEIIKPMLRGKDLARYFPKKVEYWLIHTSNGKFVGRGLERKGRIDVKKDYPKIYDHLHRYKSKLEKRQDKGEHWTNLRSCDYDEAFEEPKMIFMNMTKNLIFAYDPNGEFLTNQKCFIVTGNSLKYLTAFFNSRFFGYFFKDNFPELLGDVREVSKVYLENIPVIKPSEKQKKPIDNLVDVIIHHKRNKIGSTHLYERILEGLIAELYFPDHMKEREIDVLEFVERDMEKVLSMYLKNPASDSQKPEAFDTLADAEKEKVIEQLHTTWSHPENEVVKRMAQFKEKSPDILKPILES